MEKTENFLYSARDTVTRKLVSDITHPRKKYWTRKEAAQTAISNYNSRLAMYPNSWRCNHNKLELVTWKLIEVEN